MAGALRALGQTVGRLATSTTRTAKSSAAFSSRKNRSGRSAQNSSVVTSTTSSSSAPSSSSSSHDLKLLFDGECPLCVKEVNFLKSRNEKGSIRFVDLADPKYSAAENNGIDYETGMATIHGIYKGETLTGVEVFEKAYSCVGLGWVYSFTKIPVLLTAANKVYDVWAKYRLEITGRPSLGDVLKARKMRAEQKTCEEATEGECSM